MGVFDARWLVLIDALKELGARRAMIVHGQDGQDELSLTGPTRFAELHADGHVTRGEVSPEDVGLTRCSLDDLKGGDASHNAAILRAVMLHRATLPQTQAVQYSAGAALYLTGHASDLAQGARLAGEALQDGRARDTFERFIEATRRRAP
jgi:anthranilate phosphoribosyltransferase